MNSAVTAWGIKRKYLKRRNYLRNAHDQFENKEVFEESLITIVLLLTL